MVGGCGYVQLKLTALNDLSITRCTYAVRSRMELIGHMDGIMGLMLGW